MTARSLSGLTAVLLLLVAGLAFSFLNPSEKHWVRHTIDDSSVGADGVRLGDINFDGLPDVVTPWEQGGIVRVYLNPGPIASTKPWPAVTVGVVNDPEDAIFVDLDNDGMLDVVTSTEGQARSIYVHWAPTNLEDILNRAAWKTEVFPATEGLQSWMYAIPMEIDNQNGVDLVLGSKGRNGSIGWLQSPENPREVSAWKFHKLRDAGWIMSLEALDIDKDGDQDIVLSDRKGNHTGTYWLENPGQTNFSTGRSWQEHLIGGQNLEAMFLTVADLNVDGLDDVLTTTRNGLMVYSQRLAHESDVLWKNQKIELPAGKRYGKAVAVGDIDGDRQPDIVSAIASTVFSSSVAWMKFTNSPSDRNWQAQDISGRKGVKFDLIQLIDIDGDGDLDVLTCEETENLGLIWYENPL